MRCGHCGRKLTEAALALGYCPHCGSLLRSDDEVPMGRVHVQEDLHDPAIPPPPQAALPPPEAYAQAMPPGRTSSPQHPSVMAFPDAMQSPTTPPSMNGRTSAPYPSSFPPPAYSPPGRFSAPRAAASASPPPGEPPVVEAAPPSPLPPSSPPPPSRRSTAPAVIGTVLVLAAVIFGALYIAGGNGVGPFAHGIHATSTTGISGSSPTAAVPTATNAPAPTDTPVVPTATPAPAVPAPPSGFTTYTSTDGIFGLNYPSSWTTSTTVPTGGESGFIFTSPLTTFEKVTVYEVDSSSTNPFSPQNIETYVRGQAESSNSTDVRITQSATSQQIGKNTWMTAKATYTTNDGEHTLLGLAVSDGSSTGILCFYDAPTSSFHTDPGSPYDVMVNSFTLLH